MSDSTAAPATAAAAAAAAAATASVTKENLTHAAAGESGEAPRGVKRPIMWDEDEDSLDYLISLMKPALGDPRLTNIRMCSVQIMKTSSLLIVSDSTLSTRKFGALRDVYQCYHYADILQQRQVSYGCTAPGSRIPPGEIILCRSPLLPHFDNNFLPTVVTMFTQYSFGEVFEKNLKAQKFIERFLDQNDELCLGMKNDTDEHRLWAFSMCLDKIMINLCQKPLCDTIQSVFMPLGLGYSGVIDDYYMSQYYPKIVDFAQSLNKLNMLLFICFSETQVLPEMLKELIVDGK